MKKILTLSALIIFLNPIITNAKSFPDINQGSKLETYIDYLSEKNIIQGYPDGSFKPENTINRAEALKIIFSTIGIKNSKTIQINPFPDVSSDAWYSPYINEAKEKNIVKGYPDGTFKPDKEVNRAEFIKMATSALPFFNSITPSESETLREYSDLTAGAWYLPYIGTGRELKFLPTNPQIKPDKPMLRGDATEIIYKIAQYLKKHKSELDNEFFIPPESLIEINPIETFGSGSLPTPAYEYQGSILDHNLGAIITLENPEELESSEWIADQLSLEFKNGCMVDLFRYPQRWTNAKDFFEENLDAKRTAMMPVKSSILKKIESRNGFQVYEVFTEWNLSPEVYAKRNMDPTSTMIFIETENKTYVSFHGHGPGLKESKCKDSRDKVLKGFEMN